MQKLLFLAFFMLLLFIDPAITTIYTMIATKNNFIIPNIIPENLSNLSILMLLKNFLLIIKMAE